MTVERPAIPADPGDAVPGWQETLVGMPRRVWRSIVRSGPIPRTELEKAQAVADNFFFHIHSAKVRERTLRWKTTLGLGLLTMNVFLVLCVTGVLLMFYYVPSATEAYARMQDLHGAVFFGRFLRNVHRWAAEAMVVLAVAHMARVFLTGSHKRPREFNWVVGVVLLLLTLFMSFTGYLLPWDQLAYWAITVGTAIARYAPVAGDEIRYFLLGGGDVGGEALLRFYVLHVAVLPTVMFVLIGLHFWRVRKDGGLARPTSPDASRERTAVAPDEQPPFERFPTVAGKTYGLMAVVPLKTHNSDGDVEKQVPSWPSALGRELLLLVVTILLLSLAAIFWNAPLEGPADASHPPNPAKAPWYFLGLQEMVSYDAFWGGIGIPTVLVLLALLAPYLERRPGGEGVWFHPKRSAVNWLFLSLIGTLGVLTLIGTFFRGANWSFVTPW